MICEWNLTVPLCSFRWRIRISSHKLNHMFLWQVIRTTLDLFRLFFWIFSDFYLFVDLHSVKYVSLKDSESEIWWNSSRGIGICSQKLNHMFLWQVICRTFYLFRYFFGFFFGFLSICGPAEGQICVTERIWECNLM